MSWRGSQAGEGIAAATALARSLVWFGSRSGGGAGTVKHGVEGRVLVGVGRALIAEGVRTRRGPQQHQASRNWAEPSTTSNLPMAPASFLLVPVFHLMGSRQPLGRIVLRGDFGARVLPSKPS